MNEYPSCDFSVPYNYQSPNCIFHIAISENADASVLAELSAASSIPQILYDLKFVDFRSIKGKNASSHFSSQFA
jgi:hypothetical protein